MVETDDTCASTHTIRCTLARGHDGPHTAFRTRVSWTGDVDATARLRELTKPELAMPPCGICGGPCVFDTVVPSIEWNDVIRANELPEYLCAACVIQQFGKRGVSFTCELWGAEFAGLPLSVHFNSRRARGSQRVSAQNTELRVALREAEGACKRLREERDALASAVLRSGQPVQPAQPVLPSDDLPRGDGPYSTSLAPKHYEPAVQADGLLSPLRSTPQEGTTDDVTRIGELAIQPAPQHAPTKGEG